MVQHCAVNTCSTTFGSRGRHCKPEGLKLHRFPSASVRLSAWLDKIRLVNGCNWTPTRTDSLRICSLHFAPHAYEQERQDGIIKLKWNAVPTIFLYSKSSVSSSNATVTPDHLYSVAREEATHQERKMSKRKVLESAMNSRIPDHVYAAPYDSLPFKVDDLSPDEVMVMFPTLRVETSEDYEVIDLAEDSSDSIQEIPVQNKINNVKRKHQIKTILINGAVHILLPDGNFAHVPGVAPLPRKSTFTDSQVDKLQISRLSDENRKLQDELNRVGGMAEKLIRQNERLRQQNRVTAQAYRSIKRKLDRINKKMNEEFMDDLFKSVSTNKVSDEKSVQEAVTVKEGCGAVEFKASDEKSVQEVVTVEEECGAAVFKAKSYPIIRTVQNEAGELLEVLASDSIA